MKLATGLKRGFVFFVCICSWFSLMADSVCEFPYSLKFICNQKNQSSQCFVVIHGRMQSSNKFESPRKSISPAEVEQSDGLPPWISPHIINKCLFCGVFSVTFLHFVLSVGNQCLKWTWSTAMKSRLPFLSARQLWCAFRRERRVR